MKWIVFKYILLLIELFLWKFFKKLKLFLGIEPKLLALLLQTIFFTRHMMETKSSKERSKIVFFIINRNRTQKTFLLFKTKGEFLKTLILFEQEYWISSKLFSSFIAMTSMTTINVYAVHY